MTATARLPFVKVEGLGNDFVVVDLRPGQPAAAVQPSPLDPQVARALCDRRFGVGADGVLGILPGDQGVARMRVINADGSEAEMCGNGIRCVAKVLYEGDPALQKPVLPIDTGAGLLACAVEAEAGRVRSVSVEMGRPRLRRGEIPMAGPADERAVKATVESGGRTFTFTAVSMGNPHAVFFVDDPAVSLRALAEQFGPGLETHPLFPRRTNVEFARIRGDRAPTGGADVDVVVWERGSGITLACGTGACASVVAACLEGRLAPGRGSATEHVVHLLGGALNIAVKTDDRGGELSYEGVTMRGPASLVFRAEVDLSILMARSI